MPRTLIIDDDEPMRKMLVELLMREGHTVDGAPNGRAALKQMEADLYDLVITDIVMPDMEGLELIAHLRKAHPRLPVIAMSGGARVGPESYLQMADMLGARYTFEKPMKPSDLLAAVRDCLE